MMIIYILNMKFDVKLFDRMIKNIKLNKKKKLKFNIKFCK